MNGWLLLSPGSRRKGRLAVEEEERLPALHYVSKQTKLKAKYPDETVLRTGSY
jgi:hypothetical protein